MIYIAFLLVLSQACQENADCRKGFVCRKEECVHKDFYPPTGYDVLCMSLIYVSSAMAGASGIGGGMLFVILFVTLLGYNSSDAVALSQFTIVGSSLMPSLIKLFLKHPTRNRPLINFDLVIVILSPMLAGSIIGVIINIVLPYWLILLFLTAFLIVLSHKTLTAGIKQFKKETATHLIRDLPSVDEEYNESEPSKELKEIYEKESKKYQKDSLIIIGINYVVVVLGTFSRGGRTIKSIFGFAFCSIWYWICMVLFLLIMGIMSYYSMRYIIAKHNKKISLGYKFDSADFKWDTKNCIKMNISAFAAGFIGSIVGIGGGLVMGPILIQYGIRPEVITANTSFMILFSSTVSSFQYYIAGKIQIDYGITSLFFSLLGSAFGVVLIKECVEKYKRSSLIILTLAFVIIFCTVIVPIYGIYESATQDDVYYGFNSYCGTK